MGHIRDLPKSKLGVDVDERLRADRTKCIATRKKVITELKDAAKDATDIYVATDPDREGEAIGWHLAEELGAGKKQEDSPPDVQRDHEEGGAGGAQATRARSTSKMVDAQQARRVLDRLVGYKISPLLWDKVRRGLSAGRVQSVALKLVCDREREIATFVPEEYWNLFAAARRAACRPSSTPSSSRRTATNIHVGNEAQSNAVLADLEGGELDRLVGHDQGAQAQRAAAVHHEQAAADGALPGQEDDDARAAALRGHRAAGLGADGPSASSPTCEPTRSASSDEALTDGPRAHRPDVRARLPAREGECLQDEVRRPGRARGDPSDVDAVRPGDGPRRT